MKKKKLFKSRNQMIIYTIIFIICIVLFIVIGQIDFQKDIDTDSEKFYLLYNQVSKDNLYTFADARDVLNIVNGKSGIVLMGFPSNKWMNKYASILNDVAKDLEIDQIYYYDFQKDRDESNGTYEMIVQKLDLYVPVTDEEIRDIQSPTVLIVKNGDVIAYFDETSYQHGPVTPEVYYDENQIYYTKEMFKTALLEYIR